MAKKVKMKKIKKKTHKGLKKVSIFSNIETSSSVSSSPVVSSNAARICAPSSGSTNFTKYVLAKPTNTAIIDVNRNTHTIVTMIFPNLLGVCIFAIDVVIVRKMSGTMITNKRFKNKSPNGLSIVAFSWNIIPTIAPTIIATKRIIVDL